MYDIQALKAKGVLFDGNPVFAQDAQPSLFTVGSSGIPAFLTTYHDPKVIDVLFTQMKAVDVVGTEVQRGTWVDETVMFSMVEATGEVATYGDFSNNGNSGVNINFPQRQAYLYQVESRWGERELERVGAAKIDYANQINKASILALNKFQNKSYFYGISGLQNYGLLNDPSLSSAITPTTKAATGTSWANATALEILADVQKLYKQLQTQANGLIELDTPMVLALSPLSQTYMTATTQFNVNVLDILAKNFPNLTIETAVEYSTTSGELMQLIVREYEGQATAECAFNVKLKTHPIIIDSSSYKQKKTQGTFGTVIYRPLFIAQMLGI